MWKSNEISTAAQPLLCQPPEILDTLKSHVTEIPQYLVHEYQMAVLKPQKR